MVRQSWVREGRERGEKENLKKKTMAGDRRQEGEDETVKSIFRTEVDPIKA